MNRPYSTYSQPSNLGAPRDDEFTEDYDDAHDDYDHDDDDEEVYEYVDELDRRWIWVAGVAGAVLLVAVICTIVILGGGDSGSVSATVAPPVTTTAPPAASTPSRTPAPSTPTPLPSAALTPETVTTVAPSPTAAAVATPPEVAPAPRTITYQVTGNRSLLDLVTVIYTDNWGALQTDVNVALPWTRQIVLDPGVELTSVTATSLTGQLNCAITDASGTAIALQSNNAIIANCTK